jgi:hypothetical protein
MWNFEKDTESAKLFSGALPAFYPTNVGNGQGGKVFSNREKNLFLD